MTHKFSLSSINPDWDIQLFLQSQFYSIHHNKHQLMRNIPLPWPLSLELSQIVWIVNGSFIFASTMAMYIRDGLPPPWRLRPIVEAHTRVDDMYREILIQFWNNDYFQTVFSTIIILKCPLSITVLESLLDFGDNRILFELLKIQSVLLIPDDDQKLVDIIYTSLWDFSTSLQQSRILCMESSENQLHVTICCLQAMATQLEQFLFEGEAVKYASHYWIEHLHCTFKDANPRHMQYDSLAEKLELFIRQRFQAWFNTALNAEGFSVTDYKLELLQAMIQKAKVGLTLVGAHLH